MQQQFLPVYSQLQFVLPRHASSPVRTPKHRIPLILLFPVKGYGKIRGIIFKKVQVYKHYGLPLSFWLISAPRNLPKKEDPAFSVLGPEAVTFR